MRALCPKFAAIWLGILAVAFTAEGFSAERTIGIKPSAEKVGKYEKIEFSLEVPGRYQNPLNPDEVELSIVLKAPSGQKVVLPAFWCQQYERQRMPQGGRRTSWMYPTGEPVWKARFAPAEVGRYQATARLTDRQGTAGSASVAFECVPSTQKGFLRISQKDPRFMEFSEGEPFFQIGQNLAFIGEGQYVTLSKAEDIFAKLAENGANYLRIWTCCEDWAMAVEARKSAFGRSWGPKGAIVPMSTTGAGPADRKCVRIPGKDGGALDVSPSHNVALRPATRYVLSGKLKTDGGAAVRVELGRAQTEKPISSGADGGWVPFRREFETGANDWGLGPLHIRQQGAGSAWVADLSLKETAGGPDLLWEADVNRPVRGFYNPLDSFMLDELLSAAEKQGLYLQLTLVTRDLYMDTLKDDKSPEYQQAIADCKKLFRYAVARWGYSTGMAAWEYFNEQNPGLPTDRFYQEMGEYLEQADPYRHLRTTSTWGPSPKDCRHPKLDIADVHFYLRPPDYKRLRDEVDAVADRTRFLRDNAPSKPVHLGEFGLANEKWQPTEEMKTSDQIVDFHNAIWASALSGASGTVMYWWWDRLDQRDHYPQYRPLAKFLEGIPWTTAGLQPSTASVSGGNVRLAGLQGCDRAYLWLFNPQAAWHSIVIEKATPAEQKGVTVELKGLAPGAYTLEWWDTSEGKVLKQEKLTVAQEPVRLGVPAFTRDIACKVTP